MAVGIDDSFCVYNEIFTVGLCVAEKDCDIFRASSRDERLFDFAI